MSCGYLRFFGPAPLKAIALYLGRLDERRQGNLPDDAVEVAVICLGHTVKRYTLADDVDVLVGARRPPPRGWTATCCRPADRTAAPGGPHP